jgi:hypothetical protein
VLVARVDDVGRVLLVLIELRVLDVTIEEVLVLPTVLDVLSEEVVAALEATADDEEDAEARRAPHIPELYRGARMVDLR